MSKLEQLLQTINYNGVEFKKLNEICEFKNGKGHEKAVSATGSYIIVNSKFISTGGLVAKFCDMQICPVYKHDILMVMSDLPNGRALAKCFVVNEDDKYTLNQRIAGLTIKDKTVMNYKFLYYFLNRNKQLLRYDNKVDQTNLKKSDILNVKVPVPPLEVQREIVRVLDYFTLLTAELTAELTARKKQYEYYRDYLLNGNTNIKTVKLKDIATQLYRGNGIKREQVKENGIPCVRYGEIYTDYGIYFDKCKSHTDETLIENKKYIEYGDILFAITGESVEDIGKSTAYVGQERCLVGGDILVMKHNQNPKYLSYVLSTNNAKKQKSKGKIKSKVVHTNANSIGEIEIPLPSREVQDKLVDVLDNFETICNDLNIGLPAEIEARKKQYEFYRDLLLTFAETGDIIAQTDRQAIIRLIQYVFGHATLKLEEVAIIKNGKDYKHLSAGNYPVYGSGGIMSYVDGYACDCESVLIPRKGSLQNLYYVNKPFWTVDTIFYTIIDKTYVEPKYLFYLLQSKKLENLNKAGGVPSLTQSVLNKVELSLPCLTRQKEIIAILDRFDTLCNDLTSGLPAEIEARQKQYEYYRDKLLTFKEV